MITIRLKKGKDKAVRQLHPWVFSGAIEHIKGKPANGQLVTVIDMQGEFLAYGFYNDQSRVAVRLIEWDHTVAIDETWWRSKIREAVAGRKDLLEDPNTNCCRLIFSEADYLPGLIVDRYADFLSVQVLTSGIEETKAIWIDELVKLLNPKGIYDRSDAGARAHEGLETTTGVLYGEAPPEFVRVVENGIQYEINIAEGQKSGFYCDQRDNRRIVAE